MLLDIFTFNENCYYDSSNLFILFFHTKQTYFINAMSVTIFFVQSLIFILEFN